MDSSDHSMSSRQINFTLIELLIVISIITILAALLFPALQSAKAKSKQILCGSNLRQISLVVNMYCNDWQEYFPANISTTFFGQVESYTKRKWVAWKSQSAADAGPFWCPEDKENLETKTTFFSYGSNLYMSSTPSTGFETVVGKMELFTKKNIRFPAKLIYAGDGFNENALLALFHQDNFPFLPSHNFALNRRMKGVSFRHILLAGILYVDGHVESHPYPYLHGTKNLYLAGK